MAAPIQLIINADDFGLDQGVNHGVAHAFEHGIVTSASMMVRGSAAAAAADYSHAHPELGLGLHVDLGEWFFDSGTWVPRYEVVPLDRPAAVEREVGEQLSRFRELLGVEPTHLDSHQHVHQREPAASVLRACALALGIPLRHGGEVHYCGDFYGQTTAGDPLPEAITVDALIRILARLPAGWTELCCHPGDGSHEETSYGTERALEVASLCDPRVREAIVKRDIELCTFKQLKKPGRLA